MEIYKLVAILLAIMLLIVIGSKVIHKDDFAIITGNMTLDANTSGNLDLNPIKCKKTDLEISYPEGFNKNNCVIISVEFRRDSQKFYAIGYNNYPDSGDSLRATFPYNLSLARSSSIQTMTLSVGNPLPNSVTIQYRIILMKI